ALWLAFDDIAGKDIGIAFIFKFLYYTALIVTPQALPIGILLSSIMALGTLSENYEFAAAKSAGISLPRLVRPLIVLTFFFSALNFLFLNNVFPYAVFKQKNLYINIKKLKPTLALVPGVFNTEIPGYHIKFDEKYGEEENLLKTVMIYDLSEKKGNKKIIRAKYGKIISEEGSKYMTLILTDGNYFEDHVGFKTKDNMPASYANFDEYSINIEIPMDSLTDDGNLKNSQMYSLKKLKDSLIPNYKITFDEYVQGRAKSLYQNSAANQLYAYPDSLLNKKIAPEVLNNFGAQSKLSIVNAAMSKVNKSLTIIKNRKRELKRKRLILNLYDTEYYNRVAFSLSCLILFFIGAPLGSIIRKGGFGLPMILAISIYVLYFFTNTFGKNLAEDSSVTAVFGSWISAILMVPVGFFLTRRATKDMGIFDIDVFLQPLTKLFKKITSDKKANTN
ncbi:MAG: LptF/LptG family permease, partial [Flavobacteriaceae bacterium]|nr:LptF/LptG family permease [Flavobacteriaceae bacterium]